MGVVDEHWCNICKKPQKKAKDDYVEFEFPKWEDVPIYMCPECRSDRIDYRKKTTPRWKCGKCKATFEKPKEAKHKEMVRKKGLICRKCIEKDEKLKDAVTLMSDASNPVFVGIIECLYWEKCVNFNAVKDNPVRCEHIAVIEDKVYCKRGHPGVLELTVEKAEKDRYENMVFTDKLAKLMKRINKRYPGALDGFKMATEENMPFIGPSGVIEAVAVKAVKEKKDVPKQNNKDRS